MKHTKMTKTLLLALVLLSLLVVVPSAFAQTNTPQTPECPQNPECVLLENPGNTGSYETTYEISKVVLKTGQEAFQFTPPGGNDGCYNVVFTHEEEGPFVVTWEKTGNNHNCKDISHIEVWLDIDPTAITLKNFRAENQGDRAITIIILISGVLFIVYIMILRRWRKRKARD